jgi:hypothetical protein
MNPLEVMMAAKAARDLIRSAMVEELGRAGDLPKALLALLKADAMATSVLAESLANFEPVGALLNGSHTVELNGFKAAA